MPTATPSRQLLIPVEVKARELTAKMALALAAAEAGWTVFLGRSGTMQALAMHMKPSVYLEKNLHPARARLFENLRRRGHAVLALEEEGLAVLNYDWYVTKNIKHDMLARVDRFLAWGDMEAEAIRRRHPDLADRVVVTGNPRADIMRPEWSAVLRHESDACRRAHGRYILINSSFSRVNLPHGTLDDFAANVARRTALGPEEGAFLRASLDHANALFLAFKELVPALARAFPETPVIVRPHPSERQETWREVASDLPNVRVISDGTAAGWVAGAAAFVHNGCTTAIEGALMGEWPIAYRPVSSDRFDVPLPNAVSRQATTVAEVVDLVRFRLDGGIWPADPERQDMLRRAVANADGRTACAAILANAEALCPADRGANQIGRFHLARGWQRQKSKARRLARRILKGPPPPPTSVGKFSGLDTDELIALRESLTEGRSRVTVMQIDSECWRLSLP